MSGFEVAGVVLGAVPLIVSALESYKTSKRLWDRFRKIAMHIDELIEAIDENRILIETSVESLLQKADLHDPYADTDFVSKLRKIDIATDIQSFMGSLYEPYQRALRRCYRTLLTIVNKFDGLVPGPKAPQKSLDEFIDAHSYSDDRYTFARRIKFSFRKDELTELIAALKDSRQSLEDISRARVNKDVALPTSSPRVAGLARLFDRIQGHAFGLYSGIRAAWADKCHSDHTARFLLNSWSEAISSRRRKPQIAFDVAFASTSLRGETESCKEIVVEILNEDDLEEPEIDQARTVRFHNVERPTFIVIDSICASLLQVAQTSWPLSFYLSPDRRLRHALTGATKLSATSNLKNPHGHLSHRNSVTLQEIITHKTKFDLRDRILVAFVLVSSQLQLHSTPWLPDFWSKDILRFPCTNDPQTSEISVIYSCPFVQRHFSDTATPQEQSLSNAKRALLELGILLLEIWKQQTFTEYASTIGKEIDEGYGLRYEVAKRWLDESEQQLLPPYAGIISRCIECNIANTSLKYDWQDEMLRQSICEDLLKPLHALCYSTHGS